MWRMVLYITLPLSSGPVKWAESIITPLWFEPQVLLLTLLSLRKCAGNSLGGVIIFLRCARLNRLRTMAQPLRFSCLWDFNTGRLLFLSLRDFSILLSRHEVGFTILASPWLSRTLEWVVIPSGKLHPVEFESGSPALQIFTSWNHQASSKSSSDGHVVRNALRGYLEWSDSGKTILNHIVPKSWNWRQIYERIGNGEVWWLLQLHQTKNIKCSK